MTPEEIEAARQAARDWFRAEIARMQADIRQMEVVMVEQQRRQAASETQESEAEE